MIIRKEIDEVVEPRIYTNKNTSVNLSVFKRLFEELLIARSLHNIVRFDDLSMFEKELGLQQLWRICEVSSLITNNEIL